MDVFPNFGAFAGSGEVKQVVGALLTVGLVTAVGMLVVCAAAWALTSANGNWQSAARAKSGLVVALAGAALTGGALAWTNWLLDVGSHL